MTEIIPAILSPLWSDIEDKIKLVEEVVDWVQIDVCDGKFTSNLTWNNPVDLELLTGRTRVEIHLMVEQPEDIIADWLTVADRLIVHVEATDRLADIVESLGNHHLKLGLALEMRTNIAEVLPFADKVDVVQLMGIDEIGTQGQILNEAVVEKIKMLKAKMPTVKIAIDGGVSLANAEALVEAGADRLVVGSSLWTSYDPLQTLADFQKL